MGLFDIFKRKSQPLPQDEQVEDVQFSSLDAPQEAVTMENIKVKIDLLSTHFDTLKTQYEVLNEKVSSIEKMVREMYQMSKS